jgi:hypothetical protein
VLVQGNVETEPEQGLSPSASDEIRRHRGVALAAAFVLVIALSANGSWFAGGHDWSRMARAANWAFGMYSDELILDLVAEGTLRPATAHEIDDWLKKAQNPEIDRAWLSSDALVALRPFETPRGMYGAHSRIFLIPPGQELPAGVGESHNTVLLMDNGTCLGTLPGCARM